MTRKKPKKAKLSPVSLGGIIKDMVKKGRQAKGEKNGRAKLTYGEVENIRKIYKAKKYFQREIADQFGVSISSIRKILSEEYWKLPLAE